MMCDDPEIGWPWMILSEMSGLSFFDQDKSDYKK